MPDLLAGTTVLALDTPVTVVNVQSASFNATITSYGTTASAGTYADCAVTFVAPTTGRVTISVSARCQNNDAASGALVAPETRTGGVIGSGTVVDAAADGNGVSHYGTTFSRLGITHLLTGLTPGSTYNTRLLHRASANTAAIALRELVVEPTS